MTSLTRIAHPDFSFPGVKPNSAPKIDWRKAPNGLVSLGTRFAGIRPFDSAQNSFLSYEGSLAERTADYLHFNDGRDGEAILAPHINLDGLDGFFYLLDCRFHGNAGTAEDVLGLKWSVLQGANNANEQRILFRYDSTNKELELFIRTASTTETITASLDMSDAQWHTIAATLSGGRMAIWADGKELNSATCADVINTTSTLTPEIMGGHNATSAHGSDSPRFDLRSWQFYEQGLSAPEMRSLTRDPYSILSPSVPLSIYTTTDGGGGGGGGDVAPSPMQQLSKQAMPYAATRLGGVMQ